MYGTEKRKTVIALDYDDTITKIPNFFKEMVENWKHAIDFHIVTYRSANAYDDLLREFEELTGHSVVFTDAKAKSDCFKADIWIDDTPLAITHDWKSYGYKISNNILNGGDIVIPKCQLDYANGVSKCGGIVYPKSKLLGFVFCPYCGGKLV